MKIDVIDNTLICENNDLQQTLSYFKEFRQMPEFFEMAILELLLDELEIEKKVPASLDTYLKQLPEDFVEQSIIDINNKFNANQEVKYNNFHLAYLLYYLPANVFKIWKPLLDLHIRSVLKPNLKVLDVGTGPGSVPVGIIEFYRSFAHNVKEIDFNLHFTLIEAEQKFLDIAEKMILSLRANLPPNLNVTIDAVYCDMVTSNYTNELLDKYDIVTMSNFLTPNEGNNKLEAPGIIRQFKKHIENAGSLIIIEPGEKSSCIALKTLRNKIVSAEGFNLYSPCVGIWEERTTYDCTCFGMVRSFWNIPAIYKYLKNKGLNKAKRIDVPFNYLVLRTDGLIKYQVKTNHIYYTKLADLSSFIDKIVNVTAIIRSVIDHNESRKVTILLCDGSCSFATGNDISIIMTYQQLLENNIYLPLIAAERITLKKVVVRQHSRRVTLELSKSSGVIVDY